MSSDVDTRTPPERLRAARRTMKTVALAALGWCLLEIGWVVTGEAASVTDNAARLEAMAHAAQGDGENGWDRLALAGATHREALHRLTEEAREGEQLSSARMGRRAGPDPSVLLQASLDGVDVTWEERLFAMMVADGVDEGVDAAGACPVLARSILIDERVGQGLLGVHLPSIGDYQQLARAYIGRMRLAMLRGAPGECEEEMLRCFERTLVLIRALRRQTFLVDHLVAANIEKLLYGEVRFILDEQDLAATTAREMLAALERQAPDASMALAVEGERVMARDMIAIAFSDDLHGSGALNFEMFEELAMFAGTGGLMPFGPGSALFLPFHAGRAETLRELDAVYDAILEESSMIPAERAALGLDSVMTSGTTFGKRFLLLQLVGPFTNKVHVGFDTGQVVRAALRIMLAIEAHAALHGDVPETLGDLVPALLAEPVLDPATGGPFTYVKLDPALRGSFEGRAYLLIAPGVDATIDTPIEGLLRGSSATEYTISESVWDEGADVLLNHVRVMRDE